jgi:hypothetical protein
MILTRNQFFLILFFIFIGPFLFYKIVWLVKSKKTNGIVYFLGHTLELNGTISAHCVILFLDGKDTITFNADPNLGFKPGDMVPVRYQKNDPGDARVDLPVRIWGDTLVYALFPFLIIFVLFVTPDRLDPLIPKGSKIYLGSKPFIKIVRLD